MAGFFFAFSNPVMMAFQQLEADIFIQAFNGINISVRNGIFFAAFFVPLAALLGAALIDRDSRLLWVMALVIYAVVVIQTRMVNVPINEFFKTVSTEIPSDWQELRDRWALSISSAPCSPPSPFLWRCWPPQDMAKDAWPLNPHHTRCTSAAPSRKDVITS